LNTMMPSLLDIHTAYMNAIMISPGTLHLFALDSDSREPDLQQALPGVLQASWQAPSPWNVVTFTAPIPLAIMFHNWAVLTKIGGSVV